MTDNIYVPTDWVDGVTPVDEEHLDNTETQYRLVAGIQQMDALPAVPATGHNVCIVGNILYAWDGERWASMIRVVDTMPTPSASLFNTVVLYVGTAGTYLPTYFYICTEAGGVYSWTPFSNNSTEWGEILGDIGDQTDLMDEFGKKVDILQAEALRILVTDASKNVSLETKSTAFNKNYGTTTPIMNGTGAVGTADSVARTDHVHPSDTSKVTANAPITGGTYTKITVDSKGLATGGASLDASDIPSLDAAIISTGILDIDRIPTGHTVDTVPLIIGTIDDGCLIRYSTESGGFVSYSISGVYIYKGSKATYADLPSSGNTTGDVWNVIAAYGDYPPGTNWAWTGTAWDALGGSIDLSAYQTIGNMVTAFQATPDNTHYPCEKLVKDNLDLKQPMLTAGDNITIIGNVISAQSDIPPSELSQAFYMASSSAFTAAKPTADVNVAVVLVSGTATETDFYYTAPLDSSFDTTTKMYFSVNFTGLTAGIQYGWRPVIRATVSSVTTVVAEIPIASAIYFTPTGTTFTQIVAVPYALTSVFNAPAGTVFTVAVRMIKTGSDTATVYITTDVSENICVYFQRSGGFISADQVYDLLNSVYVTQSTINALNNAFRDSLLSSFQAIPDDTHFISEKLSYDQLALKLAIAQGAGNASKFVLTNASGDINTFRVLSASDIPSIGATKITSEVLDIARIPTGNAANKVPLIGAASTNGQVLTYDAVNGYYKGTTPASGVVLSDANPVVNGTVSPGTGVTASRTDHVHPIDTSRQANITTTTGTLTVAGWSAKSQTISITGVTATTKSVRVSYAVASRDAYLAGGVHCTAQGAGTLTFVCDTTPTSEITVNVELAE